MGRSSLSAPCCRQQSQPPESWCPGSYNKGNSKSGTLRKSLKKKKRSGPFQAPGAVARPKSPTKASDGYCARTQGASLNKRGHTQTSTGYSSGLHVDCCPDRVVDSLVESKVSEKETGNTPGSGSHGWIS